ncbi:tetraacyldisaccharide 4'-kinase [Comamonas testosteroni]|uniref:Tetraacyldisaccharide 4'-kinase n=1 Tax=Comamonas testosteroni TaxID=285 RepID=A0A0L7N9L7_COMTE|nr:tetraacyldisaccharide 4'-kinase [Comamonas testosteroni]KOC30573.1 tetraacyldisaccharide 4'-kinase [Comamonas testosteroni]KWT66454.1 Tetraacyldisaccharide 4'-kinase [Comamonas testosteroni]
MPQNTVQASSSQHGLRALWRQRGAGAWLLWPLSLVYGVLQAWNARRMRSRQQSTGLPVIVVGNVIAGGAGKTPVTQAVVAHLKASGWQPAIISRGYGRRIESGQDCREALPDSPASEVGDEPALLARSTGVPVFVASRRLEAAQALRQRYPQVDVIVSDDGLQHLALARDVELCVFNDEGVGNGFLLPAGPLREPWPRPVTATLHAGQPPRPLGTSPAFALQRSLAETAFNGHGQSIPLRSLAAQSPEAVAAVARPESFFAMLAAQGITAAATQALPDHYDFESFSRKLENDKPLICTEKDAVKLWRSHPEAWAVPLKLQLPQAFWELLDAQLTKANANIRRGGKPG